MSKNLSKLERAQIAYQEASQARQDTDLEMCNLVQEYQGLQAKQQDPMLEPMERLKTQARMTAIEMQYNQLEIKRKFLAESANQKEIEFRTMETRLENARRTVEVIDNPPSWGLGADLRGRDIDRAREKAAALIKELTN